MDCDASLCVFQMTATLKRYRVFVGSPQGLDEERKKFREHLDWFSRVHGRDRDEEVDFEPVCWEQMPGGAGRPQRLINEELKQCHYAVFLWHDRWGSPPGGGKSAGTFEEFLLAEKLFAEGQIKDIALFFKDIDAKVLSDPGKQVRMVRSFKKKIEKEKKYHYRSYESLDVFRTILEEQLVVWRRRHRDAHAMAGPGLKRDKLENLGLASSGGDWGQLAAQAKLGLTLVRNGSSDFLPV